MARTPSTMLPLGTQAPDFELTCAATGKVVRRGDYADRPLLVMFLCNHCPFVKHVADELADLGRTYQDRGVGVVAISSNDAVNYPDDAPEKMRDEAESRGYTFPYCYDESQGVAKAYKAACTPDFYVFDSAHKLVYRGQLDDARPGTPEPVTGKDLRAALDAVLTGSAPSEVQRPSIGCNIKWRKGHEPEYFLNPA